MQRWKVSVKINILFNLFFHRRPIQHTNFVWDESGKIGKIMNYHYFIFKVILK